MSASSLNREVAAKIKQAKREKRIAKKKELENALIERQKQEDNIVKHIEAEVGGVPAETSGSDSPEPIEAEVKTEAKKKPAAKKAASAKKRGTRKGIFSNRKATEV